MKVGQVWEDNDARGKGRTIEVLRLEAPYAICKVLTNRTAWDKGPWPGQLQIGREKKIKIDRMRPTNNGYRLIKDLQELNPPASPAV